MKYFRTDGIRGEAYSEVTLSLSYLIGLFYKDSEKHIVVGMDTRASSPDIAKAILSGLEGNKNVSFAGVIPTPGLMYYTLKKDCIGIMVTASHNPYKDNGIKVIESGYKITKNKCEEIERFIEENKCVKYIESEKAYDIDYSIRNLYLDFLKERIIKTNLRIIFDGANGAYSYILKELFKQNEIINCDPNGENINYKCGSTNLSSLIQEIKVRYADLGIAFDGDGDRIIVVDKYNRVYEGDFLIYVFARDLFERDMLKGNTVVFTEIVNPGITNKLNELGIYTMITEVGDNHITKALEREYVLGGESSGHIINKWIVPYGDGLSNALELIRILTTKNKHLYEYSYEIKMHYTRVMNLYFKTDDFEISKKMRDKIEKFANKRNITLILRKSGTEKAIRIFIYQPTSKGMNKNMERIVKMIKNAI